MNIFLLVLTFFNTEGAHKNESMVVVKVENPTKVICEFLFHLRWIYLK